MGSQKAQTALLVRGLWLQGRVWEARGPRPLRERLLKAGATGLRSNTDWQDWNLPGAHCLPGLGEAEARKDSQSGGWGVLSLGVVRAGEWPGCPCG